jgi:hypothetical protein
MTNRAPLHISTDILEAHFQQGWWPYKAGNSEALEPTVWCALACRQRSPVARQAIDHLLKRQNADGGWSTMPESDFSDWSTGLAIFGINVLMRSLPKEQLDDKLAARAKSAVQSGLQKLSKQRADIITDLTRVGMMIMQGPDFDYARGWPWAPDTYNWAEPTAYALLAIKSSHLAGDKHYKRVVDEAHQYLLDKACAGGGWNFGAPRALGTDWPAMPPPTALVLIALQDVRHTQVDKALEFLRANDDASAKTTMAAALTIIARALHGDIVEQNMRALNEHLVTTAGASDNLAALAMAVIAVNLSSQGNPLHLRS